MTAQTQRIVLKEILIEDSDQFLKQPETGAKPEAIQSEREETGKSQTCGSLNKRELELSSSDGSCSLPGRGSCPHYLRSGVSRSPSVEKRNLDDGKLSCGFPEASLGKLKNLCGSRRLEDATVILRRVKDPRPILSNVDSISTVPMATNCLEAEDVTGKHLKETVEPINVNTEEESKLALAAIIQECSVNITRSSSLDSLELSFSIGQESVAIVGLNTLKDGGITQTHQDSSDLSSDLNSLKEDEMTVKNEHFSEEPTVISDLQDLKTTSSKELSSDRSVIGNDLEDSTLTGSLSQLSSSLEAELHPAQSSETCDLPTPVSMTTSPEDTAWWSHLTPRKKSEALDEKKDVDDEVLLNFSRMSSFEACSVLGGVDEVGSDLNDTKEMDNPRSSKKKRKRSLKDNTSEPQSPETPCDKGSTKKQNCRRISSRLKIISGITEESDSKDADECSKEGIIACAETETSESKGVLAECDREIKAQIEDQDAVGDQLKFEDKVLIDAICQPMSLRSRRSSVIQDVSMTCAKLAFEETKDEIPLGDLSFKEEIKHQSQRSVRKTDKKLRTTRPPLLHCDWLVGDLLWAKMAGHPWWPCMLTYDPSLGLYTRSSTVGKLGRTRYHVRFFGEKPYRAWIADGSILRYKGVEAFKNLCAEMSTTDLVHRSPNYYRVKDSRRRAWDAAVEESEKMSRLTRKDRLLRCNSVSSTESSKKSSITADETRKSKKEREKSLSFEKMEHKTPEGKRTRLSGTDSLKKSSVTADETRKSKQRGKSLLFEKMEPKSPECKRRRRSEPPVQTKSSAKDPLSPDDDSQRLKDRKEDRDGNCRKEESKSEVLKLCGSGGTGGGMRKGNVCLSCEKEVSDEELVSCEGSCLGSFHRMCLGLAVGVPTPFVCDECTTGSHTCFVCKVTSVETVRCSVSLCGRFYHSECLKKLRLAHTDKRRLQCSLHTCVTCTADDIKNPLASKGSLLRCVRCPTAYHSSDFCLTAGSERLAGNAIVCSRHLSKSTVPQHVNVNWCFLCSKGGTLLCCESCPAAFHFDCLKIAAPPTGSWECEECIDGKRPLYGEIVWAKLGNYRWWPGEICHPRNCPDSLMGAPHQNGEFPVQFFGTHNYFWANIGRVFLFQEDDKGSKESIRNGLDKSFSRAVQEANAAIRVWMAEKEKRDERSKAKADRKPPPYKHLKASVVVGNVSVHRFNLDDIHPCSCRLDMVDPCGPESKCLNRDLSYECHPEVCPVDSRCQNRRFQQREYASVVPFKTENRGWGLKTLVDVKEGQFVIEYVGELIDHDECRRRMKEMQTRKNSSFYLLTLDKDRIIDAGPRGNVSRFMNHSCQPNCETQKWTVNGDSRIGLFSIVDIPAGSELTFNYNLDCLGNEKLACHCGSAICSGYLGLRPKQSTAVLSESSKKKKKRRPKKSFENIHENECFRCGKTGQLIMCDKIQCPKVYHLKCLRLKKAPHGKWICPWHHCDECGQPSTQLCNECENSFCVDHIEGNITEMLPGYLVCSEHDEWRPADDPSNGCSLETGFCNEDSISEKLGLRGMEGRGSELVKIVEGKLEDSCKNSKTKRNQRRSSVGICEKNAIGKRKRERKLSTNALIKTEGGTKLLKNVSSAASKRNSKGKGSATIKYMLSSDILSRGGDGSKRSRTGEKASTNDASRQRKRKMESGSASFSAVSKKNSTRKYQINSRRKSLPENQIQREDMVECFETESGKTSTVSSKRNSNRRQTISVVNFKGVAKLKRKREESLEDSFTFDPIRNEDVAELSLVKTGEGNQKMKRSSKKSSSLVTPAKRTKIECTLERGHTAVTRDSKEAGMKSTKESRKKSLKIKDTEERKKIRKVLKKTVSGVRASTKELRISKKIRKVLKKTVSGARASTKELRISRKIPKVLKKTVSGARASAKESRMSKKSLASLNSSVVSKKASVVLKKKLGRPKRSDYPLKISKTSKKNWTVETQKSTCSEDLQEVLEVNMSDTQHEAEFHNNTLKSVGRKLKRSEGQRSRQSGRFVKQSDNGDGGKMETEEETQTKLADVEQVQAEATEITRLKTQESFELIFDIPVAEHVEISCGSEEEVTHLEVTNEKSRIEEDSTILKVQDETSTSPVKLTKQKVLEGKGQRFGSSKRVMRKQSFEDETVSQTETKNLKVKEDKMGSETKMQALEITSHSGLDIEAIEIEVASQKDSTNLKVQGVGMESEKETENLENVSSHDLQKHMAAAKILDDSKRETDEIISEITKNNLPDSLVINSCSSKFKTDLYDTPSDSSESDGIFLQDGDFPDMSADVDSSVQLDKKREECPVGNFPIMSKDVGISEAMTSIGMNAVMIDEAQLVDVLLPAESVGGMTNVKHEAELTSKDGIASSFVGSAEMRTLSRVEDVNGLGAVVNFIREPVWKRNHSSGNASLKSKDGSLKDCDLFPRTY